MKFESIGKVEMENESNQELLSWEECREQIIELGKFELKNNKWFCGYKVFLVASSALILL